MIIIIGGIFIFIFKDLKNEIKYNSSQINKNADSDEKKFKNIFIKLREIEDKFKDITSLENKN